MYIKKLCILKQIASGFAADGKKVSALLTAEKSGNRITLSLALIGFAPLASGRYRFLVCDRHGSAESFDTPPAGCTVKKNSSLDLADGFCCLVCFVGGNVSPVAFGKCGDTTYDVKKLCALLDAQENPPKQPEITQNDPPPPAKQAQPKNSADQPDTPYDDELVATENYYEFAENGDWNHAEKERKTSETRTGGESPGKDEDAQSLFRFTGRQSDTSHERTCYYDTVKNQLDALMEKYPPEEDLAASIPFSRWAKISFSGEKYYVVGVIRDDAKPKYICYGVPAKNHGDPPDALKGYCSFMPLSVFDLSGKGYWMMFQDAETGQCVHIKEN